MREVDGGPEAIGSSYIKRFPHLPYQEITVNILDHRHPVTAGVQDFVTADELYCLEDLGPDVTLLASYDARAAEKPYTLRPGQAPDPRHEQASPPGAGSSPRPPWSTSSPWGPAPSASTPWGTTPAPSPTPASAS